MFKLKISNVKFNQCLLKTCMSLNFNITSNFEIDKLYRNYHSNNFYRSSILKYFSSVSSDFEKENINKSLQSSNSNKHTLTNTFTTSLSNVNIESPEPEDYRTIYIENLPQEWTEDEIKVRLQQIGPISKLHLIKDSIGTKVGKVLAVYQKVEHVIQAIDYFKDKMPLDKPVKIRFFRESLKPQKNSSQNILKITNSTSSVLIVKNLPDDLRKEDLNLFISEFREPIHISYPRDHENEFKKLAFIYFKSNEDAEHVLKYANMRYVKNKQLFFQFSFNHFDITDFRTRIELGIKLEPAFEIKLYEKQISDYKMGLENKKASGKKLTGQEHAKLEYLNMRKRKLEYALGLGSVSRQNRMLEDNSVMNDNENLIEKGKSNSNFNTKKFLNKDKVDFNQDKSIVFLNSHKYFKKN